MLKLVAALPLMLAIATPALTQTTIAPATHDRAPWWMKESVITQTGYVFTEIPANRAGFSATFLTVDKTVERAQAKAIENTKALNEALSRLGKDKVRVNTTFTMRPLYEQYRDKDGNRVENQRGDKIDSYEVRLTLSIEVRDTSVLERAYALVLAASPTSTTQVNFNLEPDNATKTWLYNEAVKDARVRATGAATAAGATLDGVKVIDPTGRACETDILGRDRSYQGDGYQAVEVQATGASYDMPPPAPPMARASAAPQRGTAEFLEYQASENPFIQTPPLHRLEQRACVVYGLR